MTAVVTAQQKDLQTIQPQNYPSIKPPLDRYMGPTYYLTQVVYKLHVGVMHTV
jgi:hypothetical protein